MRPLCGPAARWWWPHRNHRRFRHAAPPPGKQKTAPDTFSVSQERMFSPSTSAVCPALSHTANHQPAVRVVVSQRLLLTEYFVDYLNHRFTVIRLNIRNNTRRRTAVHTSMPKGAASACAICTSERPLNCVGSAAQSIRSAVRLRPAIPVLTERAS
ncbi:Uncharacterised protein [Escherichia coli]|nr:Uncharacterised protein [Escherichia coli]